MPRHGELLASQSLPPRGTPLLSTILFMQSFALIFSPMRIPRAGAGHDACASGASQQHRKTQWLRALSHGPAPMHVTSPRTLVPALLTSIAKTQWIRALSHGPAPMYVTSPRTLVPALLARHTWRNLRARMIFRHVLLVGTPICPNAGKQGSKPASGSLESKNASPGNTAPSPGQNASRS